MYQLKTLNGTLIFTTTANNLDHAIELYCNFKQLSKDILLSLFTVTPK